MRNFLICGFFNREDEDIIQRNAKKVVEYSSNNFQRKIIDGFLKNETIIDVVSAPEVGSFPNASRIIRFDESYFSAQNVNYVSFFNLWGVRNFSRKHHLVKRIRSLIEQNDNNAEELRLFVYSVHTPFIEAAVTIKKLYKKVSIILIVPDLPQYMNLETHISLIYKIGKKYDIYRFNKANRYVDGYMLLTDKMKEKINIHGCPYFVAEGILDTINDEKKSRKKEETTCFFYAGKLFDKFGVLNLVKAFMRTTNEKYRLVLCGKGECEEEIEESCNKDPRIIYKGQVRPEEVKKLMKQADVLVNPRQNNEIYTRYSFPSKNIEYLSTGKPVVLYLLDGMEKEYANFCTIPYDDSIESLKKALVLAAESDNSAKYQAFLEYSKHLEDVAVADKLCSLLS